MVRVGDSTTMWAALAAAAVLVATGPCTARPDGFSSFGPTPEPAPSTAPTTQSPQAAPVETLPLGRGIDTPRRAAPPRPDSTDAPARAEAGGAGIGRVTLALCAVLALALVAGLAVRAAARRHPGLRSALGAGGRAPAGLLEVLGRYPVGRGATLVLLKLDRRVLLLSQTTGRAGWTGGGGAFATLCEITDPDEVASILVKSRDADGDSMSERFRSLLTRFDSGMDVPDAIPVVDLTRREAAPPLVSSLRRRLDTIRRKGAA